MKLILLTDVTALGKTGDVVDVAEGYARNFLLPRKLATEADKGALARHGEQRKAQQKRDAQVLADAQALAARLETAKLSVKAKAGGNGRLFGAVTNAAIALAPGGAVMVTLRFLTGAALAWVYPPGMKIIAGWFRERRGSALGVVVGAVVLGSALPHLTEGPSTELRAGEHPTEPADPANPTDE